ncbi:hypothetical protein HOY82DRAFT_534686 [Tuber indicum]|nr:hypothetical protein HOY82DRAFT_534686 [Tuber indicum]
MKALANSLQRRDRQPRMDHNRIDGEGFGPQECTALNLKALEWAEAGKKGVMIAPGRWLSSGAYRASSTEFYVCTGCAARNRALQGISLEYGVSPSIDTLQGYSLVGTLVHAPLSVLKGGIRVLTMESVLTTKGTGVSSVPSDSPDDYHTVKDVAKKAHYYERAKRNELSLRLFPFSGSH